MSYSHQKSLYRNIPNISFPSLNKEWLQNSSVKNGAMLMKFLKKIHVTMPACIVINVEELLKH